MNNYLIEQTRGDVVENCFKGSVAVVNENGDLLFSFGNIDAYVLPRSAIKYVQVLPLLAHENVGKYQFTADEIAVMCASHNSEQIHLDAVRSILNKINANERDLGCGGHEPSLREWRDELHCKGEKFTDIYNNCSGKHSGFLALAKLLGQDIKSYLEVNGEVQTLVANKLATLSGLQAEAFQIGTDGCSAPNFAMPLKNLAQCFANLHSGNAPEIDLMITAITQKPYMVAGKGRFCTDLMKQLGHEVIGKVGAAGVYALSFYKRGIGMAVKIESGQSNLQYQLMMELLKASNVFSDEALKPLERYRVVAIKNCNGFVVGEQRITKEFEEELGKLAV